MLTNDTIRVMRVDMFFKPIIARLGINELAKVLGIPAKNVRRWDDMDSIPADWWKPVAEAGVASLEELAEVAEARRVARSEAA